MDLHLNSGLPKIQVSEGLKNSRNSLVEIVLLIIVAVLFYWFLVIPKAADLSQKQTQLKTLSDQQKNIEGDVATLKNLSQELSTHPSDINKLDEALPLSQNPVRLQILLNNMAQSSGVLIGNISVNSSSDGVIAGDTAILQDPYAPARALQSYTVNINVSGTMNQLVDLIKKLESYGRLMDISSLGIAVNKGSVLDMKISLSTYYYIPQ